MASVQKPPRAANAAIYDKTQKSGNKPSGTTARIDERSTALKGSTGGPARKPTPGSRQAAKVAGGK